MTIEEQPTKHKYYPRIPHTHTLEVCEICYREYSKIYDPDAFNYKECMLCFLPCSIIADIVCCIPMIFGCYTFNPSEK